MDCPKCKSTSHIKQGQVGGRQRYKCKNCAYAYTVLERGKPMALKKLALQLYLEGMGFRGIGRVLKVSHVAAYNWVRKFAFEASQKVELSAPAPIIEMDELHSYIGSKKTAAGFGRQLIGGKKSSLVSKLEIGELQQVANFIMK